MGGASVVLTINHLLLSHAISFAQKRRVSQSIRGGIERSVRSEHTQATTSVVVIVVAATAAKKL